MDFTGSSLKTQSEVSRGGNAMVTEDGAQRSSSNATRIWDYEASSVSERNPCPEGTCDNSPTFQRWGISGQGQFSPEGTAESTCGTWAGKSIVVGENSLVNSQPSLRDLWFPRRTFPTLKRWAIVKNPSGMRTKS